MPVFNEGDTIRSTILEASRKITKVWDNVAFVVSEDGSTDDTKNALISTASELPNLQIRFGSTRRGYPLAAKDAIVGVTGKTDYISLMDSDGQYDPSSLLILWQEASKHEA